MQASINTWEGGLIVAGGALKHTKYKFQNVGFKWRDGHWTYAKPSTPPILKIWGEDNSEHTIDYIKHTKAIEVVGLLQAPDGNQSTQ
eukprot:3706013-Ditylum_brightwellii.AAC.1